MTQNQTNKIMVDGKEMEADKLAEYLKEKRGRLKEKEDGTFTIQYKLED